MSFKNFCHPQSKISNFIFATFTHAESEELLPLSAQGRTEWHIQTLKILTRQNLHLPSSGGKNLFRVHKCRYCNFPRVNCAWAQTITYGSGFETGSTISMMRGAARSFLGSGRGKHQFPTAISWRRGAQAGPWCRGGPLPLRWLVSGPALTPPTVTFPGVLILEVVILLSVFNQWFHLAFLTEFLVLVNTDFSLKHMVMFSICLKLNYIECFCHILRFVCKWRFPLQISEPLVNSGFTLWVIPFSCTSFSVFSAGPLTFEAIASIA